MGLFGSSAPSHEKTKEKVNEISKNLRQESRKLDRQIYGKQTTSNIDKSKIR